MSTEFNPKQQTNDASAEYFTHVRMPAQGARAANVMMDAIIAQQLGSDAAVNQQAYTLALQPLAEPTTELDESIADEHIFGAGLIAQAWFANQLAAARGSDLESVVAEYRAYVLSVTE